MCVGLGGFVELDAYAYWGADIGKLGDGVGGWVAVVDVCSCGGRYHGHDELCLLAAAVGGGDCNGDSMQGGGVEV